MDAVTVAEASLNDQAQEISGPAQQSDQSVKSESENRFQKAIAAWRSKSVRTADSRKDLIITRYWPCWLDLTT